MSINPISVTSGSYSPPVQLNPTPQRATAAAAQEATETSATTRKEAAKGDPVAIRKLAQQAQQAKQVDARVPTAKIPSNAPGRIDLTA